MATKATTTPALVLLPGLDGTARLFARFGALLQHRFDLVPVAYPADRCASRAELLRLMEAAIPRGRDYVLIAESFSGSLAIEHAAARPQHLRAVVLVASFAANPLPPAWRWLRVFAGAARARLPGFLVRLLLVGSGASADLVRDVRDAIALVEPSVVAHRLRAALAVDVRPRLRDVAVPVLCLRGVRDRLVGARGPAQCLGRVPRLTFAAIGGPHLLLQACPQECAAAIGRFLDEECESGGPIADRARGATAAPALFAAATFGTEWDWFACDEDGHVAIVSSGGSGQVPLVLLQRAEAIRQLLQLLGIECDGARWRHAAAAGLFAYDVNMNGGPFRRLAAPRQPKRLQDFPEPHRTLIALVAVRGCFRRLRRLDCSRVGC